jgi:hypothetical protein
MDSATAAAAASELSSHQVSLKYLKEFIELQDDYMQGHHELVSLAYTRAYTSTHTRTHITHTHIHMHIHRWQPQCWGCPLQEAVIWNGMLTTCWTPPWLLLTS